MRRRLQRLFRAHRPDIVHTFLFGFDHAANRAARAAGVPVVLSSRRQLATWKKSRHIRLQKRANRLVDCIVANSEAAARFAMEQEGGTASKYRVIPNGIDPERFISDTEDHHLRVRFKIPFHTHVIGIVANFSPVKDHALFLQIAEELMRRRADVHFLMVGTGPGRKNIQRQIRARGWGDQFSRIASVEEIPELLRLMSVSVLCSKMEGSPNAVMEAVAAGTPVVAAAVGGVPELIQDGEGGRLVATRNPVDFADAIEWVLDHPEESRAAAERGAAYVRETLTIDRMVDSYRNLYNGLLGKAFRPKD